MTLPANHEQLPLSPDGAGRPRFLLRDSADINRVLLHLVTHWTPPRVEFRIDSLPSLASQRAQDRFVRLAGDCNCLIGELLGATTLVIGSFLVWTLSRSWPDLGLVLVATLYAALLGKGIELTWTRLRLLLVLRGLRRRLGGGEDFDEVATARPAQAGAAGLVVKVREQAVAQDHRIQRPLLPYGPERPRVLLRDAADINRLVLRLVTRWTLPRIEIRVAGLPALEAQRAQDRFMRLSGGCSFMLAGLLVTVSLLGGLFYILWTSSRDPAWTSSEGWRDAGLVGVAMMYAGLIGAAIEVVWIRVRLVLVLRRLRRC